MLSLILSSSQTSTGCSVTAAASGGVAPYSYTWQPQAGLSFASPNSANSIVTVWDGGAGGVGLNNVGNPSNGPVNTGGTFNLSCTVIDSTTPFPLTTTALITVNGADRRFNYFNADASADAVAANIAAALIPAYLALADGAAKAQLLTQASIDIDRSMRFQGRRYNTITQATEFPRVAYEPSNAILPNTGAAGIPGGSAFGSTIWDVDPGTLGIVVPANVLQAVVYQANYIAGGRDTRINDQYVGVRQEAIGSLSVQYSASVAMRTGLCFDAYRLIWKYAMRSGRLL